MRLEVVLRENISTFWSRLDELLQYDTGDHVLLFACWLRHVDCALRRGDEVVEADGAGSATPESSVDVENIVAARTRPLSSAIASRMARISGGSGDATSGTVPDTRGGESLFPVEH